MARGGAAAAAVVKPRGSGNGPSGRGGKDGGRELLATAVPEEQRKEAGRGPWGGSSGPASAWSLRGAGSGAGAVGALGCALCFTTSCLVGPTHTVLSSGLWGVAGCTRSLTCPQPPSSPTSGTQLSSKAV